MSANRTPAARARKVARAQRMADDLAVLLGEIYEGDATADRAQWGDDSSANARRRASANAVVAMDRVVGHVKDLGP